MIRPFIAALIAALAAAPALGQPVTQGGQVTPNHPTMWMTNGIIGDAGTSDAGGLTTLGITSPGTTPFCINNGSVLAGPYSALCLGINPTSGATLTVQAFGGATPLPLNFNMNGNLSSFSIGANGVPTFSGPTASSQLILGAAPNNVLTLTPGATSSNPDTFVQSGTGGYTFDQNVTVPTLSVAGAASFGSIDGTPIGTTTPSAGAFTTLGANGAVSFTGSGTALTVTNNATFGSINSSPIGATTRSSGAFTTLAANGAATFTGSGTGLSVTNNATVGGTSTLGNNSTNFTTIAGGSASTTISAAGTGSSQLLLRGLGSGASGQVNIGGTLGGGAFQIQGAATNGGALQFVQPAATTSPFTFQQATNTAGVLWSNVQTRFSNTWAWAGLQTNIANRGFQILNTISGTVQDPASATAVIPVNVVNNFTGFNAGGIGARGAQFWSQIGTGTVGPTITGLSGQVNTTGVPGYPSAWAQSTSYSVVGALVVGSNGALYRVEITGVSASTGAGPVGTGSAIVDGTVTWSWQGAAESATQMIGISGLAAASQTSPGASASATVGSMWGGIFGAQATSGANNWANSVGVEIDDYWNGGPIDHISAFQVNRNGIQATHNDWGVSISAHGSPAQWKNAMLFQTAVDANGYGIVFEDQQTPLIAHMAGVFDARLAVPDGNGPFGGGFYYRWVNGSIDKTGSILDEYGSVVPTSNGLTIDITRQGLTALTVTAGGANWAVGMQWKANDGSYGTVATVTSGAIATVNIVIPSYVTSPPGSVTLTPLGANPALVTATGTVVTPTPATATPTYAAASSPAVVLGGSATVTMANTVKFATSTTGAGTQTLTNSPCTGLTTEKWIPVTITGQSGTWFVPACQ